MAMRPLYPTMLMETRCRPGGCFGRCWLDQVDDAKPSANRDQTRCVVVAGSDRG